MKAFIHVISESSYQHVDHILFMREDERKQ